MGRWGDGAMGRWGQASETGRRGSRHVSRLTLARLHVQALASLRELLDFGHELFADTGAVLQARVQLGEHVMRIVVRHVVPPLHLVVRFLGGRDR